MRCYTGAMGLYIRQDNQRSDLQQRLAEELKEKARKKAELENQPERPDGVKDSTYMRDFTGSSRLLWLWIVVAVVVLGVIFAAIWIG